MRDNTQLGTAAVAAGCCALCAAQCWAARAPRAAEQLIRTPAHRHPQFPDLPTLDCAQRSGVVRVPRFLSTADIEALHRAAEAGAEGGPKLGTEVRRWEGSSPRWTVAFLHTDGHFLKVLPDLAMRMEQLVRQTDAKNWRLLEHSGRTEPDAETGSQLRLRCCEYHRMMEGGHLGDVHHHDEGSVITLDIMLTPSGSYEGGELSTLERLEPANGAGEASEVLTQHQFEQGDALLFVSHKYHCVAPVTKGTRQVLVAEYWWGEQRECGHRCDQHWGRCEFTPDSEKMDMFFDELVGSTEGGIDVMAAAAAAADDDDDSEDSEDDSDGGGSESAHARTPSRSTPPPKGRHDSRRGAADVSVFSTPGGTEAGFMTPRGTRYTNVD